MDLPIIAEFGKDLFARHCVLGAILQHALDLNPHIVADLLHQPIIDTSLIHPMLQPVDFIGGVWGANPFPTGLSLHPAADTSGLVAEISQVDRPPAFSNEFLVKILSLPKLPGLTFGLESSGFGILMPFTHFGFTFCFLRSHRCIRFGRRLSGDNRRFTSSSFRRFDRWRSFRYGGTGFARRYGWGHRGLFGRLCHFRSRWWLDGGGWSRRGWWRRTYSAYFHTGPATRAGRSAGTIGRPRRRRNCSYRHRHTHINRTLCVRVGRYFIADPFVRIGLRQPPDRLL